MECYQELQLQQVQEVLCRQSHDSTSALLKFMADYTLLFRRMRILQRWLFPRRMAGQARLIRLQCGMGRFGRYGWYFVPVDDR